MIDRDSTDSALTNATVLYYRELHRLADRHKAPLVEQWIRYSEQDRAVEQSLQTTAALFTELGLIAA